MGRPGCVVIVVLAGCSYDAPRSLADHADATRDDASPADSPDPDAAAFVCSTRSMMCPGNQPLRLLACGAPTECWVGCRDGDVVSANQAAEFCAAWGGRLGRINSADEEVCVRTVLNGAIILGLTQAPMQAADDEGWSWNGDGLTPPYLPWSNGQPDDNGGIEDGEAQCAFSNSNSVWDDMACDAPSSARFTCRYP